MESQREDCWKQQISQLGRKGGSGGERDLRGGDAGLAVNAFRTGGPSTLLQRTHLSVQLLIAPFHSQKGLNLDNTLQGHTDYEQ